MSGAALSPSFPDSRQQADPTALTTAQLQRELESLRLLIEARLDGMDKASVILDANVNRVPTLLDRSIEQIKALFDVKFSGVQQQFVERSLTFEVKFANIEKQFDERDVRTEQAAIATKIAVDAALQAQKESANQQNVSNAAAIAKSETATTKQIDGILALMQSTSKAMDEKIDDLKGRIDRGEGLIRGGGQVYQETRRDQSLVVAIIAAVFTALAVVVAVVWHHA